MENILETINKSALKFLAPLTPEETYKTIVDEAIKLVDAEYGSIILVENGELQRVYSSSELGYQTVNRSKGNTTAAFRTRKVIVADITETGKFHPELKDQKIKTSIFIPLAYKNQSIGVLTINSRKRVTESERELQILKLFGSMATLAIKKVLLYHETKEALELRDEFVSLAAHELRTPLTTMNGYIQLLERKFKTVKTVEGEWIKELSIASIRLTRLINQLLEMNRLKSGRFKYTWEEVHIPDLIIKAMKQVETAYPERTIELLTGKQFVGSVIGDKDKITNVLFDFLDNAAKFSDKGTAITVMIKPVKRDICISIQDQGKGMEQKEVVKMFESFYKGEDNLKEGWGLGMYLAYVIIKEHHGQIKISSSRNKGTTVSIYLPIATL